VTIWRMRIASWIPKSRGTLSQYVIIIAFPQQQWLHERISMLRYTYIACLVGSLYKYSCIFMIQCLVNRHRNAIWKRHSGMFVIIVSYTRCSTNTTAFHLKICEIKWLFPPPNIRELWTEKVRYITFAFAQKTWNEEESIRCFCVFLSCAGGATLQGTTDMDCNTRTVFRVLIFGSLSLSQEWCVGENAS